MSELFERGAWLRQQWGLERGMHFLNHGSFGACPNSVLAAQQDWRHRMEAQPVRFMSRELPGLLRVAANRLGDFLGARGEDIAFVENATAGVNAVLRSFPWQAGDEVVLSSHAYPAVKQAVQFVARQFGLSVREFDFSFPLSEAGVVVEALRQAITARTRMALLEHVSSPLALIYPLEEMLSVCREHGVATLVDGAHAPGMLPLGIERLGADWYVGNGHKWLFAPKGCAFLWAAPGSRAFLQPTVVSLYADADFPLNFDWVGTRDPTAWLAVTAALDFYELLGGKAIPARLHQAAILAARELALAWQTVLPVPEAMLGAMVTLPVPLTLQGSAEELQRILWERFRVEVPVFRLENCLWVRISVQHYNTWQDVYALRQAVLVLSEAGSAAIGV